MIQQHYDECQASAQEFEDGEAEKASVKIDRAQLLAQSASLFKLEVALICTPTCQKEVYALLAHDNVPLQDVSDRLYYKTYYQASQFHGQLQLDLVRRCNTTIHETHVNLRRVLKSRSLAVSFETHAAQFARLAYNLDLHRANPPDTLAEKKCSIGKHWESAGFQGEDPSTDFRGVGELGLHQLDYFCDHHPLYAQRMIRESGTLLTHPDVEQPWYPFALCGIHTTKFVSTMLERGQLQRHLLQAQLQGSNGIEEFIDTFYSFCFIQCHLDWAEGVDKKEITSVFQFEAFFAEFSDFLSKQIELREWTNDDFYPQVKWW